jgi:hypothetical protein
MTVKRGAILGGAIGVVLAIALVGVARLVHSSQGSGEGMDFAMTYAMMLGVPTSAFLAIPPIARLLARPTAVYAFPVALVVNWSLLGALAALLGNRGRRRNVGTGALL